MNTYNIAGSTKLIFFQLFAISFPILCQTQRLYQTKEIFLKQGKPFILQCKKNNVSKNPPKLDLQIQGYKNTFCLSGCEFQSSVAACIALANLTSNFYCGTGKYCDKHDQCNFVLIMPLLNSMAISWHAQTMEFLLTYGNSKVLNIETYSRENLDLGI